MDGRLEASFNPDKTQVLATIHPASGGKEVTSQDVVERLKAMGVVFGIREAEITKAVKWVADTNSPATKVVVAQGVLPEDGQDAQVTWHIDHDAVAKPLPRAECDSVDLPRIEGFRRIAAGAPIATIHPARSGTPGKTITADLRPVPQSPGKNATISAGDGVHVSPDGLALTAAVDGYLEIRRDHITVHEMAWLEGELEPQTYAFRGSVVIVGNLLRGGSIEAQGSVACLGTLAGVKIRSRGDVVLAKAARCRIAANGNVRILGVLKHCELIARGAIWSAEGAAVAGGSISTTHDIDLHTAGDPQYAETRLCAGLDALSDLLHEENRAEIARCEANDNRIAASLRPLMSGGAHSLPPERREILVKLQAQRNELQDRIRELHTQKRNLMLPPPLKQDARVRIRGAAHPGVIVAIQDCTLLVESAERTVEFRRSGGSLERRPLSADKAA